MNRTPTEADRRNFLRYTDTGRWPMLERFPIAGDLHTELLAQMLACTPEAVRALIDALHEEARAAAEQLLTGPGYRRAIARLPFGPDDHVVAVGDSITADRLGWFELLATSIGLAGAPAPALTNLSVSGNTTADVLERFDLLESAAPSHVLLMLGTNDARAHGRRGTGHRMATAEETERNVRALVDLITGDLGAAVTVITPTAVDQDRIDAFFRTAPLRWQAAEVAEVAAAVRRAAPAAIDVHDVTLADPSRLEPDGVHPTPAGQRALVTRIAERLAGAQPLPAGPAGRSARA